MTLYIGPLAKSNVINKSRFQRKVIFYIKNESFNFQYEILASKSGRQKKGEFAFLQTFRALVEL